jgi:anti-sigma B factor antagonist
VETSVKQQDQTTVVSITGSVDALTAGELTDLLLENIDSQHVRMVVDLGEVDFMSSAGLRAIMTSLKESRKHGGDLRLAAAQPGVEKILKMSGFTSIMKSYSTLDQAVSSFGS